ncbi:MAG: DUF1887 family protein [Methanobacteriota archaeon]|nr:MAG: DUF1887 family protein [Euryarchaeota archaeon]
MKNIGILLMSDQTIPILQFVHEMDPELDGYLIVTTEQMQGKGVKDWVFKACDISDRKIIDEVVVPPHDLDAISQILESSLLPNARYHVNLTTGTKMMAIAVYDLFKRRWDSIYYVTYNRELIKIFPSDERFKRPLKTSIKLKEYLTAYGHKPKVNSSVQMNEQLVEDFFAFFLEKGMPDCFPQFFEFRNNKKTKSVRIDSEMRDCLQKISSFFKDVESLDRKLIKFITGDWLEHWVYKTIKAELRLSNDYIAKSVIIEKKGTSNELDVVFVFNDQFYTVECKSSLFKYNDKGNIIANTVYKSDSLQSEFGLYPRTAILTMDDLDAFSDKAKKRAKNKRITLIGKQELRKVASGEALLVSFLGIKL